VSSIPIAMRVVCTTTMALGCRTLAKEKAIVARLSAVEELAGMDTLCSDKTGTLTMNKMEVLIRCFLFSLYLYFLFPCFLYSMFPCLLYSLEVLFPCFLYSLFLYSLLVYTFLWCVSPLLFRFLIAAYITFPLLNRFVPSCIRYL
jgi:uncharacterized protein YqhQ